ncbi:metallophosphoesterase [Acidobacteria bacterium AB60]|nr:metallophosphoesterase [Acidobacteria bacterium AB60]
MILSCHLFLRFWVRTGSMPHATFAVVSDLHCRLATAPNDSFLKVGAPRIPSVRHPVESLLELVDNEHLTADVLLAPGDLTNQASREGLEQGWNFILEIAAKLGVRAIPVVGNHDIDSHRQDPDNPPTHMIRTLRRGFPFQNDAEIHSFFSEGYCLQQVGDAQLIAINTVIDHTDAASAKRGTFGVPRIEEMERVLRDRMVSPLRGALMHHHPILHSGPFLRDTDVIATGDALLDSLRRLGCRFVIHGHKHITRLSYVDRIAVLACGSFSAMLHEYGTSVGNTFHLVSIKGDSPDDVRGTVRTWVFQYGFGWSRSNLRYKGFPYLCGFGRRTPLPEITAALRAIADAHQTKSRFSQDELLGTAPDVEFLTPAEREDINRELKEVGLKLDDYDDGHLELWRSYLP